MRPKYNINPRTYLVITFALSCVLLTIFSFILYNQNKEITAANRDTIYKYENLRQVRIAFTEIQDMEIGSRGYFLTGGTEDFLLPYENAYVRIEKDMAILKKRINSKTDPALVKQVLEFETTTNLFRKELQRQISVYNRTGRITLKDLRVSKHLMDEVRVVMEGLVAKQIDILNNSLAKYRKNQREYQQTMLFGTLLAIGALFIGNLIIITLINRSNEYEKEIKETESRMRLIMTGINDGIFDYKREGNKAYFSSSLKNMLGYNDDEFPDNLNFFYSLIHKEDYNGAIERIDKFFRHEIEEYHDVIRLRAKDGSYRWLLTRGVGVWDENNKIARFICAVTNITAQKRSEEELKFINSELENFTYVASHDLRSPLVNIKGFVGEIEFAVKDIEKVSQQVIPELKKKDREAFQQAITKDLPESLKFIKTSVERMDSLTSGILELSRIGKREVRSENIDAKTLVQRCVHSQNFEINKKKIQVTIGDMPNIVSDPNLLEQVFANIIDNAVKYYDPKKAEPHIKIEGYMLEGSNKYVITDNGIGIPESEKHKVFSLFRRAANAADERGVGMGMSYVLTTIRRLHGTIRFESELGKGTIFFIKLPPVLTIN